MPELGDPLSQRELEVLQSMAAGATNKEIAASLTISRNTVKVHLRNIFSKLGVSSRTEAMTAAIQRGLVTLPTEIGSDVGRGSIYSAHAVSAGDNTSASETGPNVTQPSGLRRVPRSILFIILIGSVFAIAFLGVRLLNNEDHEFAAEPFEQVALGDTGWFENRPLPAGRAGMAIAAVGLNVYQIGGETTEGIVPSVQVYDTAEHTWHNAADKPTTVTDASAAVLFGEIYVPGGRLADGSPSDVVEVYSPTNDAWRIVAALPQPVAGGLALSDASFLYLLGGWNGERYLDTIYVYDAVADSWRPLSPTSQGRAFAAGGVVTGRLYMVGGFDGRNELALCQYFDTQADQWNDCPDMLLPRAAAGAAVVLNKLYVIGGGMNSGASIEFSEVYDPNSENWQVVNTPMLAEEPRWPHLGVVNVEVRIYSLGGIRGETESAGNFVYAPRVYKSFIPAATSGDGN